MTGGGVEQARDAQLRAAKQALRERMRDRRLEHDPAALAATNERVTRFVSALPAFAAARTVTAYGAMHGEIDPAALAATVRARGGAVAWPRVVPGEPILAFHVATSADLRPSARGIPQPPATLPIVALADVDVFLVPGLAFDMRGGRLGWGRGYYDATLAAAPRALRVGLAHSFQLLAEVPTGPGDTVIDLIVTEKGVVETGARPPPPRRMR